MVGPLLAAPPARGQLQEQLQALAAKKWRHPITGHWVQFGFSTIEGWYYTASAEKAGPVEVLQRKIRSDQGQHPAVSRQPWSTQLTAIPAAPQLELPTSRRQPGGAGRERSRPGARPSYASVLRFMKDHGLIKRPRRGPVHSPGAQAAEHRFETREVRSYENQYVNGLWHLDFHHGSVRVLLLERASGPIRSCWASWMIVRASAAMPSGIWPKAPRNSVTALSQAFQKRALPRALMTDNGSAMLAAETEQGLARLSIVHETTLPLFALSERKARAFWNQIEGRLLPMLEGVADLTLAQLNEATLAWVRWNTTASVIPNWARLPSSVISTTATWAGLSGQRSTALAFTAEVTRTQRRSDGTISLEGVRFEVPSRYGHFPAGSACAVASWDLSQVYLADPTTGTILCRLFPLDKHKNAEGQRAARDRPVARPPLRSRRRGHGAAAAETHPAIRRHRTASGLSAQRRTATPTTHAHE